MAAQSRARLALLVITLVVLGRSSTTTTVDALTCGQVVSSLLPCLTYLRNGGPVTPQCCGGVRSLQGAASDTPARQTACGCIKKAAGSYGVNYGNAGALAGKCGVSLGYPVTPSTDCSKLNGLDSFLPGDFSGGFNEALSAVVGFIMVR